LVYILEIVLNLDHIKDVKHYLYELKKHDDVKEKFFSSMKSDEYMIELEQSFKYDLFNSEKDILLLLGRII